MLKVKDDVKFEDLKKYGFIEEPFDKWHPKLYGKRLCVDTSLPGKSGQFLAISKKTRRVYYCVSCSNVSERIDLLFDMITDGVLEKVNG